MKKLLLIIIVVPVLGLAQNKNDNTIVLPVVSFNTIKSVLFDNGYSLLNEDTIFITSTSKETKLLPFSLRFMINRSGQQTYLKALYRKTIDISLMGETTNPDFTELDFSGMKNSPYRRAWDEVDRIAKQISTNVSYTKR
jgi:hypothetical protein